MPAAVCGISSAVREIHGQPEVGLSVLMWVAATTVAAICARGRFARLALPGVYAVGLIAIGFGEVHRGFSPAWFFLWGASCDLAGYALVAAIAGWAVRWGRRRRLREPSDTLTPAPNWFSTAQACLSTVAALLAVWIASDSVFEGLGEGVALLGLSGRMAACPAALMLVGTAIVMAWQTAGRWRGGWQYGAMICGVLFTASVGWARLDVNALAASELWYQRGISLLTSLSMMTLLTSAGLARFLPASGDWILRGRRVAPIFGGLAMVLLVLVLVIFMWRFTIGVV